MQQKYVRWTKNLVYCFPELTPVTLWAHCVNFYTLKTFRYWYLSEKVMWRSYISGHRHLVVVTLTVVSPWILKRFCIHQCMSVYIMDTVCVRAVFKVSSSSGSRPSHGSSAEFAESTANVMSQSNKNWCCMSTVCVFTAYLLTIRSHTTELA